MSSSYRSDLEASHARANALATELAQAKQKIAELEGERSLALVPTGDTALARNPAGSGAANKFLGGPTRFELMRELNGELPETAYTEMVECIRLAVNAVGTVSVLPGSLAWSANSPANGVGPFVNIYVTIRDGRTVIRADERLGQLAGAIFGGIGGGVGLGGIMAPIATVWIAPILVPIALSLWLGGSYLGCRKLFRSRIAKRAVKLEKLMDDLAAIADKRIREVERATRRATSDD